MGAMADPGDKYRILDAKLARALRIAANGNATYQVRIQEEISRHTAEEEAQDRPIRGRQVLLIIHQFYKTSEEFGTHYSPKHIYMLKCPNNKKLEVFLNEWHTTIARIPKATDEDQLREQFLEQLRNCDCMGHALRINDSADPRDEKRSCSYLLAQVNRQLALRRQKGNEEAIKTKLMGRAPTVAPANSNQHCPQWTNKGNCRKGAKCGFRHDANRRGSNPASSSSTTVDPIAIQAAPAPTNGKGKGKGTDKGGAPPNKGGGKGKYSANTRPCFEFSKGKCTKADKCPFVHRKLTPEGKVKRDEWARAKEAQAKGGGNTPRAIVKNPNAACAAYIRGNCKKGAKCNLHHIDIGERQTVSSAPATSSNQTASSSSAGPVIVESPNIGFVNSILRRAVPAFTPGARSEAKGRASR